MFRLMVVVFLFVPALVHAQFIPTYQNFITIESTPEYPSPNVPVTLTAKSTGGDSVVAFRWLVDGKNVQQGVGVDQLTLTAGALGESTTVTVLRIGPTGDEQASVTHIIHPADLDLVWEGNTTVPPFYIGRPLGNTGGTITVKAIPFLTSSHSDGESSISFQWSIDGKIKSNLSGYGKSTVTVAPPFFNRPYTVSVIATTQNGSIATEKQITISPIQPTSMLYEDNPLLGVLFNRAMQGSMTLNGTEATLHAFPLFMNTGLDLIYTWSLNKKQVDINTENTAVASFRRTGAGEGGYPVGMSISSEGETTKAESSFILKF